MSAKNPVRAALAAAALVAGPAAAQSTDAAAVVAHYADMGHAVYQDSLRTARVLDRAVDDFLRSPTRANLETAREAWKASRVPYGQSEIHRFGNPPVDAWEGRVNAWPLDEGLIDYVVGASAYEASRGNEAARANVVANRELEVYGRTIDAATIDVELLRSLHELVQAKDAGLDESVRASLADTLRAANEIENAALAGRHFDQLIKPGNAQGAEMIGAVIEELGTDTRRIVDVAGALGIEDLNTAL